MSRLLAAASTSDPRALWREATATSYGPTAPWGSSGPERGQAALLLSWLLVLLLLRRGHGRTPCCQPAGAFAPAPPPPGGQLSRRERGACKALRARTPASSLGLRSPDQSRSQGSPDGGTELEAGRPTGGTDVTGQRACVEGGWLVTTPRSLPQEEGVRGEEKSFRPQTRRD